jgi:hypothetical protein
MLWHGQDGWATDEDIPSRFHSGPGFTGPLLFGGGIVMKSISLPKIGLILVIGFSFILLPLVLVSGYLLPAGQDQPTTTDTTQSIPDTFSTIITQADRSPAQVYLPLQGSYSGGGDNSADTNDDPSPRIIGGAVAELSDTDTLDLVGDAEFDQFLHQVFNGDGKTITGVYVEGVFSLRVLQQPPQDVAYVSDEFGTATQFQSPAFYGVVGLLAHNYLSGRHFLSLTPGLEIRLVYGDGAYRRYRVVGFADFERLTRFDVRSDFRDLHTQTILTSRELFDRFYRGENFLTLQTCLEGEGISNWGIRMVSAMPIDDES